MSDTSQGPGWWQAADGKWYAPDQPPAPGWWRASDGNWYPPAEDATAPTSATPTAAGAGAAAKKGGGKGLLVVIGIFVVLVLIGAGVFVATRNNSSSTASNGGDGGGNATNGQTSVGAPRTDGQPAVPALGDDAAPDSNIKLAPDVIVVRGNGGKTIVSAASDGSTMVLDKSVEGVDKLEAGKVLLLTGMTAVKVKSITTSGDNPEITTEPAILPDVIADGELSWKDQAVDPDKAQLVITGDKGWEYGPNGDGGAGSSGASSSGSDPGNSGSSGDGSSDSTDPSDSTDSTDSTLVDPGDLQIGAPLPEGESAAGRAATVQGKTISGKAGGFAFDISYDGGGGAHHLDLKLKPSGDVSGTIDVDVKIASFTNTGNLLVSKQKVQNFDFNTSDMGGKATITTDLKGLQNVAKWKTPAFFKLPFSLDFPAFVGGIPFTLSLSGTIQVNLVFSLANSSLSGQAEITYDGDAGLHFNGTKLSLDGKRSQDAPDLLKTIQGVAPGPVGVVFTTELPKIGFGFKFLQTGAGIYISQGMVVSQNILPPPVMCTAANTAYVLAGGVEASFLGHDIEIARKAFVDKRWNWAVPANDKRCNDATPGGG